MPKVPQIIDLVSLAWRRNDTVLAVLAAEDPSLGMFQPDDDISDKAAIEPRYADSQHPHEVGVYVVQLRLAQPNTESPVRPLDVYYWQQQLQSGC